MKKHGTFKKQANTFCLILGPFAAQVKVVAYFHRPLWNFINSVSASCPKTYTPLPLPTSLPLSSPSTQQASLQHENELNLILQLLSISYSLGSQTVLLKPSVPFPIQSVSFISSVVLALLVQLSPAQPPIFETLRTCLLFFLPPTLPLLRHPSCRYPAVRVESGARQNPDVPPLLPRVSARVPRPAHQQPRQDVFQHHRLRDGR